MPREWSKQDDDSASVLTLWPHQSLPPRAMAAFVLATFFAILLPLIAVLGTKLLWALLPFLLAAVAGLWFALTRSKSDRSIREILTITPEQTTLNRSAPRVKDEQWNCNTYWVRAALHPQGGPVPNYVTLKGGGREVEIGSFLSEEERIALFSELQGQFGR